MVLLAESCCFGNCYGNRSTRPTIAYWWPKSIFCCQINNPGMDRRKGLLDGKLLGVSTRYDTGVLYDLCVLQCNKFI